MILRTVQILCLILGAVALPARSEEAARPAIDPAASSAKPAPTKSAAKGTRVKGEAEKAVRGALPPELTQYFPIGSTFTGVSIPSYEKDRLKSVLTSETVVRVDEKYLDLHQLVIFVYNSDGKPETSITMEEAAYDLVEGMLTSKTPSKIEQPRFTMTGDTMTFETATQVARLTGNVLVVVPDAASLAPDFGFPGSGRSGTSPAAPSPAVPGKPVPTP